MVFIYIFSRFYSRLFSYRFHSLILTCNETWLFKWCGPDHLHATHTKRDDGCEIFTKPPIWGEFVNNLPESLLFFFFWWCFAAVSLFLQGCQGKEWEL